MNPLRHAVEGLLATALVTLLYYSPRIIDACFKSKVWKIIKINGHACKIRVFDFIYSNKQCLLYISVFLGLFGVVTWFGLNQLKGKAENKPVMIARELSFLGLTLDNTIIDFDVQLKNKGFVLEANTDPSDSKENFYLYNGLFYGVPDARIVVYKEPRVVNVSRVTVSIEFSDVLFAEIYDDLCAKYGDCKTGMKTDNYSFTYQYKDYSWNFSNGVLRLYKGFYRIASTEEDSDPAIVLQYINTNSIYDKLNDL